MQKILFLVILVLLAFPAIVTSPVSVAHASPGPAFFEAVYDYLQQHDQVWFTTAEEIYDWYTGQDRTGS